MSSSRSLFGETPDPSQNTVMVLTAPVHTVLIGDLVGNPLKQVAATNVQQDPADLPQAQLDACRVEQYANPIVDVINPGNMRLALARNPEQQVEVDIDGRQDLVEVRVHSVCPAAILRCRFSHDRVTSIRHWPVMLDARNFRIEIVPEALTASLPASTLVDSPMFDRFDAEQQSLEFTAAVPRCQFSHRTLLSSDLVRRFNLLYI
jgi:hypothetical protein